jgi:hypothetical protein
MKFRDLFRAKASHNGVEQLNTRELDTFADNVIYELKTLISNAVAEALEEKESRYLRSILEDSFFTLDTLVIKALDAPTYRELEDFLSNHESINPSFRTEFFHQVVQNEYRSSRGASVRTASELRPIFEVNPQLLDSETEDESFILSLKGRKVRFQVRAVLSGPTRRMPTPVAPSAPSQTAPIARSVKGAHATTQLHTSDHHVHITWHDRHGTQQKTVALPALLGREMANHQENNPPLNVELAGTYVSRRQLVVFENFGQIFCYVPSDASLTCSTDTGHVLPPDTLHRLEADRTLKLITGVPMDTLVIPLQRESVSDYPRIDIQLTQSPPPHDDATPRPRAVR